MPLMRAEMTNDGKSRGETAQRRASDKANAAERSKDQRSQVGKPECVAAPNHATKSLPLIQILK
jgi:hypothetical protein